MTTLGDQERPARTARWPKRRRRAVEGGPPVAREQPRQRLEQGALAASSRRSRDSSGAQLQIEPVQNPKAAVAGRQPVIASAAALRAESPPRLASIAPGSRATARGLPRELLALVQDEDALDGIERANGVLDPHHGEAELVAAAADQPRHARSGSHSVIEQQDPRPRRHAMPISSNRCGPGDRAGRAVGEAEKVENVSARAEHGALGAPPSARELEAEPHALGDVGEHARVLKRPRDPGARKDVAPVFPRRVDTARRPGARYQGSPGRRRIEEGRCLARRRSVR